MSTLEEFIEAPSLVILTSFTRDELLRIAGLYKIEVRGSPLKAELLGKLTGALCTLGIIAEGEKVLPAPAVLSSPAAAVPTSPAPDRSGVQPITKGALELRRIELREKAIDRGKEKRLGWKQTDRGREKGIGEITSLG